MLFPNSITGESDYAGQRTAYQNGAPILSRTDSLLSGELRTRIRIATRSVPHSRQLWVIQSRIFFNLIYWHNLSITFTNKGLICNSKLMCNDRDENFSPIEDGKTGMGTGYFPERGSGDVDRVDFSSIQGKAPTGAGILRPIAIPNLARRKKSLIFHNLLVPILLFQCPNGPKFLIIVSISFSRVCLWSLYLSSHIFALYRICSLRNLTHGELQG